MSSPGYSSARLRPRRAGLRFTRCAHLTNRTIQLRSSSSQTQHFFYSRHSRHDRCGQLATGGTARSLRRERQLSLNGKSRVSREAQARFREGLCQEDAKASCCAEDEGGPFETAL